MKIINRNNFFDHFSFLDLELITEVCKNSSTKTKENTVEGSVYIEFLQVEYFEDRKLFIELITVKDDDDDVLKYIHSIYISESPEDVNELLDKMNEYSNLENDGENKS